MGFAVLGAFVAFGAMWIISVRRRLIRMDENINNAMGQIGVQLSARFDALIALMDMAKGYADHETQMLIETLKSRRNIITASSSPEEVQKQESVIAESLNCISMVAEKYTELKSDESYIRYRNAVDSYEKMICTSSLIYNDSVAKLNRELQMFPTMLCAGVLGVQRRNYLEAINDTACKTASILN